MDSVNKLALIPGPGIVEDHQLLSYAKEGDAEAFGRLYERYADRVFRYLFARLGNRLDAEDLAEDVFLRVWRSLPNYQEQGVPFLAILFRIAHNALIDHYRRSNLTKRQVSIEDVSLRAHHPGPGELVLSSLERDELRAALEQLREDYRTVLVLRFLGELTPQETAQIMGRSEGTVRVLQHRALASLRKMLNGDLS
jgi:RNA polymerase sigma-70 factor (ECF subfamily)